MLQQYQPLLHEEFRKINLEIVHHGYLSTLVAKPTLEDQIIVSQRHARGVRRIKENIAGGVVKCFSTNSKGMVLFGNRLVVPKNRDLRQLILKEAYDTPLSIDPGGTKCTEIHAKDFGGLE